MKILLIVGGWSTEREISLAGGQNIAPALQSLGHSVTVFDLKKDFDNLLRVAAGHDFAFINLHGAPGEDGLVQALLDSIACPYQGSGPAGSFLALNKAAAKQVFRARGLPTADWEFLPQKPAPDWQPKGHYPYFVKSNTGGSSLRLGQARDKAELDQILTEILAANEAALLEPRIQGKEVTCGILAEQPLPPILIEPLAGTFFDHKCKYAKGAAREICPAPITAGQTAQIQDLALKAHKALGLYGYSRADFILSADGSLTLLEVNTLPGMTSTSLVPQEAAQIGLDFPALLQKLIDLGLARSKN